MGTANSPRLHLRRMPSTPAASRRSRQANSEIFNIANGTLVSVNALHTIGAISRRSPKDHLPPRRRHSRFDLSKAKRILGCPAVESIGCVARSSSSVLSSARQHSIKSCADAAQCRRPRCVAYLTVGLAPWYLATSRRRSRAEESMASTTARCVIETLPAPIVRSACCGMRRRSGDSLG